MAGERKEVRFEDIVRDEARRMVEKDGREGGQLSVSGTYFPEFAQDTRAENGPGGRGGPRDLVNHVTTELGRGRQMGASIADQRRVDRHYDEEARQVVRPGDEERVRREVREALRQRFEVR